MMKSFLLVCSAIAVFASQTFALDADLISKADDGDLQSQVLAGNKACDENDLVTAKKYFLMAALQGSVDGMNNIAYIERGAMGGPKNNIQALKWYLIGEWFSGLKRIDVETMKQEMNSDEIQTAELEANNWIEAHPNLQKAASN